MGSIWNKYLRFVWGLIAIAQPSLATEPQWAYLPTAQSGSTVAVSCHGTGPDKDISFRVAMGQCQSIAAEVISGSFDIKTLSIETEQTAGFHSEVAAKYDVTGLKCKTEKEHSEIIDDIYNTWLRCRFNSSLAKIIPLIKIRQPSAVTSKNRQIIFSSIPECNSLVIHGTMDRMVRCKGNPQTLLIYPTDSEIIVRSSGRIPKHVELVSEDGQETEIMEIYLEKH